MSYNDPLDDKYLNNGLILSNTYFPEEIIINILSFVQWPDLLSCRLVCVHWKGLVDGAVSFNKITNIKNSLNFIGLEPNHFYFGSFKFFVMYAIGTKKFGSNLLKNSFGNGDGKHTCKVSSRGEPTNQITSCTKKEKCPRFKYWVILSSEGDGWKVENTPAGCDPLPEELEGRSCFATSWQSCVKTQWINLKECGLTSKLMDTVHPHFEISEWCAARHDCGVKYSIKVCIYNEERNFVLAEVMEHKVLEPGTKWYKVTFTIKDYGPGARYILFEHSGKDRNYWAGHYGAKMAGASVVAKIPPSPQITS